MPDGSALNLPHPAPPPTVQLPSPNLYRRSQPRQRRSDDAALANEERS